MAKRDFYEILGVSKTSTETEIKKAYRKVALKYHPDRNPGDSESEGKFKEAAEAYEVLSNKEKRARYDRFGHAGVKGNPGGGGFHGAGGMNIEDIFENFGDIFGDMFSGGRGGARAGGGRQQRNTGRRGTNLRVRVKLTLEEISKGAQKKIKVPKYVGCNTCSGTGAKDGSAFSTCTTCNGMGAVRQVTNTFLGQMQTTTTCPNCQGAGKMITNKCTSCKGDGRVYGEETITIDIPAGVSEGIQLSMTGKGNAGERGGSAGDLIIGIEEIPHEHLQREGNDVIYALHISFIDATLGTTVEIPTISSKAKIKIPQGTPSGKIFRLKGKGLPSVNSYGTGDQLVEVNVWIPKSVSAAEKSTLEKLRNSPNFKPNPSKGDKNFFDKMRDYFH
ncbi:MAG: molecular chaperone DnaJ [Chitinophagales bacterium]